MPVTIPVGFGQATIRWRFTGATRDSVVVLGYDPPTVDPGAHATAIHGFLTAAGRPCAAVQMMSGWQYQGVRCTEMTDTGPLSADFPGLVSGSIAGAALPPNIAILIRKRTLAGGRRNRGRIYVPPLQPTEGQVDERGVMGGAQATTIFGLWDGLRSDMQTAGLEWVIFHSQVPFTPTPVTGVSVDTLIATQRRRLRK